MDILVVVNMQNDFKSIGALPLDGFQTLQSKILCRMDAFDTVIGFNHIYGPRHMSFVANHPWKQVGHEIILAGKKIKLTPLIGIMGSLGASSIFKKNLDKIIEYYLEENVITVDKRKAIKDLNKFIAPLLLDTKLFLCGINNNNQLEALAAYLKVRDKNVILEGDLTIDV